MCSGYCGVFVRAVWVRVCACAKAEGGAPCRERHCKAVVIQSDMVASLRCMWHAGRTLRSKRTDALDALMYGYMHEVWRPSCSLPLSTRPFESLRNGLARLSCLVPAAVAVMMALATMYAASCLHTAPFLACALCPRSSDHSTQLLYPHHPPPLLSFSLQQLLTSQVDPKFLRNQRYAKHGSEKALREARAASA